MADEKKSIQEIFTPAYVDRQIFTFNDFVRVVGNTYLMIHPKTQYVHAYPIQDQDHFKDFEPPLITYHLNQKVTADMGNERELKPRIRTITTDPNNPQQKTTKFGHRFMYLVDFGLWESSWEKLNQLAEGFEEFMLTYTGEFKKLGVSEIVYAQGLEDVPQTSTWKTPLVAYHVFYEVYIEKSIDVFNQVIEKIDVINKLNKNIGGE